jgi:hypothetical protein
MKIDIFSLEYLKFIFSSFWVFTGFMIILSVITGELKKLSYWAKDFIARVSLNYRAKLVKEGNTKKNN